MSKNYKEISESILQGIGGKENVVSAAHCATRLRLVLKDDKKADVKVIEEIPAVKGSFNTSGQFQIILGSGVVDEVYKELKSMYEPLPMYSCSLSHVETSLEEVIKDIDASPKHEIFKNLCNCHGIAPSTVEYLYESI